MILERNNVRSLASAVVLQAVNEARAGNSRARYWLLRDGLFWLDALGFSIDPYRMTVKLDGRKKYMTKTEGTILQLQEKEADLASQLESIDQEVETLQAGRQDLRTVSTDNYVEQVQIRQAKIKALAEKRDAISAALEDVRADLKRYEKIQEEEEEARLVSKEKELADQINTETMELMREFYALLEHAIRIRGRFIGQMRTGIRPRLAEYFVNQIVNSAGPLCKTAEKNYPEYIREVGVQPIRVRLDSRASASAERNINA